MYNERKETIEKIFTVNELFKPLNRGWYTIKLTA